MSEWEENPLERLTLLIKDGTHGTHKDVVNGIPLLSAKDIYHGKFHIEVDCRRISLEDYKKIHATYEFGLGDILLTVVGTIGRVAIISDISEKITFQRSVALIRFDSGIFPKFAYYQISSAKFVSLLERSMNASAQGGVYLGELAKINIYYPPLPHQRKIARILTTVDNIIEKTESAIEKYKAIKQGMMHDLFTRGIDVKTGKLRPSYEDAPELYKETDIGMVPKEWGVDEIGSSKIDIADGDRGVNYPKNDDLLNDGFCLFLSADNVTKGGFVFKKLQFITKSKDDSLGTGQVIRNDIVITTRGTIGNIAFYKDDIPFDNLRINSGMLILRNLDKDINPLFLYFSIANYLFDIEYKKVVSGSAQPQLPMRDLMKFYIIKPKLNEQFTINDIVVSITNKIDIEHKALEKMSTIKQALMQDLLTGKKKVTPDPDDFDNE